MIQNFLETDDLASSVSVSPKSQIDTVPGRESIRLMAIGSREGVLRVIHTLHRLRFAEISEWSPLLPAPTPGEVMSILTRYLCMKSEEG
ncbi:MAG: hypothetical protein WBD58_14235 [Geitlerinemataceae cyanobacterium]